MRERVKILSGMEITHPKAFLIGSLETGIVAFTLGTKFVSVFEVFGSAVDRKSVIVRDSNIFGATRNFSAIIPFSLV